MFHVEQLENYDIIVLGGGHAGIEAAWSSSEFGLKVALVTMPNVPIGSTPCNPAIGGVGKGQVVREIDALGGIMGRVADLSGIQYRILNESKGYAVQSTRVQVDKDLYAENAEALLKERENLVVIREKISKVINENGIFYLIFDGGSIGAKKIIVTTGTFLAGELHIGSHKVEGGRVEADPSSGLENMFSSVKKLAVRFKTGTPPRIKKSSIKFDNLIEQKSDAKAINFHYKNYECTRKIPQVSCYLTNTNEKTLKVIRDNKDKSPLFNGQIKGVGPRYCPSIEDKAFRYLDRDKHHVFLEPESLEGDTVYPNGISTSLPEEYQEEFLQTIDGLESSKIAVYGYAVEYDVVDTSRLEMTLEHMDVPGLYFAGQVNGTSGYEEAAGQGLIAGLNAAHSFLKKEPIILDRSKSYIGVMIEDLVSSNRDEPYRLFTARSENRLYIREDNSINRLYEYRDSLGFNSDIDKFQKKYLAQFNLLLKLANDFMFHMNKENKERFSRCGYGDLGQNISLSELVKRPELDPYKTLKRELENFGVEFLDSVVRSAAISIKYEGYINRSDQQLGRIERLKRKRLSIEKLLESKNISYECKQRIEKYMPKSFNELQKIEGIRPATLTFVANNLL